MMDFSLYFPTGFTDSTKDDSVDVRVELADGRTYSLAFFTLTNLETLMARWGKTGECANGMYVCAKNMIVVQEISRAVIRKVVHDLVKTREIEAIGWPIRPSE